MVSIKTSFALRVQDNKKSFLGHCGNKEAQGLAAKEALGLLEQNNFIVVLPLRILKKSVEVKKLCCEAVIS